MLSTISTRVDSRDKKEFETLCENLGLNVSVAINIYIKKAIRDNAIPILLQENEEKRKPLDFSKYTIDKPLFKSTKEIDDYMREMREDRI